MTDFYVSNEAELQNALSSAQGGDTIVLADGDYGSIDLSLNYDAEVTIRSENTLGANFDEVNMAESSNLTFEGISVGTFAAYSSENIELSSSDVNGLLYLKNVNGATITGNDIDGDLHAMLLNNVQNFTVSNNKIHTAQEDLMRVTGDSYNGVIEENYFFDTHPEDYRSEGGEYNHSDFIQMFSVDGDTPHDIVISRNVMYDDPTTGASTVTPQGIFLSDPGSDGYKNILIEQNLISVRSVNSIYINGGQENVVVQDNTLMASEGGGAIVRLADKSGLDNSGTTVTGNVMKILYDQTESSTIGSNYIYGRDVDMSELFQGDGSSWESYLAVEGSALDLSGMGATEFLADLVAGKFGGFGNTPEAVGTENADTITGTAIDDEINGEGGNDLLTGYAGEDTLYGGDGNDRLRGGFDGDLLDGGDGIDRALYNQATTGLIVDLADASLNTGEAAGDIYVSIEQVVGTAHADELWGDDGDNGLWGGNWGDLLDGRDGADTLYGGNGNDKLRGGLGGDLLDGEDGIDRALYNQATTGVVVDLSDASRNTGEAAGDRYRSIEQVVGSSYDDEITGDSGDNTLWGGDGSDVLNGGDGNDRLFGGSGADSLTGGAGKDQFVFNTVNDSAVISLTGAAADDLLVFNSSNGNNSGSIDCDQITDFTRGEDLIDLTSITVENGGALPDVDISVTASGDNLVNISLADDDIYDCSFLVLGVTDLDVSDFLL
ncbi:right-handed parallel beta-helix repeat-containing protein [Tropicimonas sp. TH_r6]|uniref:calcium-binding protein n=1 Tax=Tropicimonas sp. TH_r6 TaxID=3082085 RepID=UPI00295297F6|nr:right-handed parallel beta-helix repeat-containing protein [Tropicimonas sp. TH_r6]MDV7145555.1 right-handed parallel beta-helix repeat-containing protein [Tropicimonas sp. TH_r6]